MSQADAEMLEAFSEPPARNEREILLRVVESMGEIASRAYAASQDHTIGEDDLRSLMEDVSLDLSTLFVDARNIAEDESQGSAPEPSEN